jgi:tryptophanyl-tRNA synthetase
MKCATRIAEALAPLRQKREYYESHTDEVKSILADGETSARAIAHQTMVEVHSAMGMG